MLTVCGMIKASSNVAYQGLIDVTRIEESRHFARDRLLGL